ncbi:peptidase S10, serine carboxypeptidase [Backusella circina FSU 941]|nr:peptidase S10, serine carboxypeptidase [Backusella circina FSU 941]
MLLSKKILTLATVFGSALLTSAFDAKQVSFKTELNYDTQGFHTLQNDAIEGYSVRIKQPKSCEDGIQYSGYVDKHDTDDHFFFYFFESRTDPSNDPTVLWLNGGPGCSSMMGLWMELGPCQVNEFGNGTIKNPFSWNTAANIVFLDQPVNVGYSYGKTKVRSTEESARDVYAFLQLFLGEFSDYARGNFHISGESYGGHYLPALSSEIIKNNKVAEEKGLLELNYESMLIGNGWTDPLTQFKHYETFACANDSPYKPIFDEETCEKMRNAYPRCEMLSKACYNLPSSLTCIPAGLYCEKVTNGPFDKTGLNPYDIRKKCEGDSGLCYSLIEAIEIYANDEDVRANLGVDDAAGKYAGCSDSVGYRFYQTGDGSKDFTRHVADTLEAGVRVLLYVGDMDWICNWVGNLAWSLDMDWYGKENYNLAKTEPWLSDFTGIKAGEVRSHDKLTFLRIYDAGHMVPYDQPENALDFFNKWLSNTTLSK